MEPTHNTLPEAVRARSVEMLGMHLSAAIDLHAQVKIAHWNVRGPGFIAIHLAFGTIAASVNGNADMIAERICMLGGAARGALMFSAENSYLAPYPLAIGDVRRHIAAVASTLATFGHSIRVSIDDPAAFGDAGTASMLKEITRAIDRHIWIVESHMEPK